MAGSRRTRAALGAICVFVAAVGLWNVVRYPPGLGYDANDHIAYADGLVPGGHLPQGEGEYYTPPGYYAVAGSADWVAEKLGVAEPHRAGMLLNVFFLIGTVLLVWRIASEVWPGHERFALGAATFVALLPVSVKTAAMFHPETMSLFFTALALWLCVRTFADPRYAFALGLALGLGQLVRAPALWTVLAAAVALAVARRWRELAVALVLAALVPLPWYVHQAQTYSGNPLFPRPATAQARNGGTVAGKPKFILERRPLRFYVDPGLPAVISSPYRPHYRNLLIPTTYTDLWGDYFGVWAWRSCPDCRPPAGARFELTVQALAGLLPTLLAVAGWFAFLGSSLRSPSRLALALVPLIGLLAYLGFTVSYPTPDGDVLKATYMLSAAVGWALGFGYALERLRGKAFLAVAGLLAACVLADLPFLVYA